LDNVPEYFALSYTWGEAALCKDITLDGGKVLKITQNCADALRRMMRGKTERMIWVDSICINQSESGLEERGQQVALMDEIYRKAGQVNVFLGVGDAASDTAVMAI
ncbi:heterokaryon incompatibility, partial [Pyrenochaeta sp. MPI-SDFR-AT-0127]